MHKQFASKVSLIVFASLSSQVDPGRAGPFTTPRQSVQVLLGVIPVVPPEQVPQASMVAVPFTTPAQSVHVLLGVIPVVPPEQVPQASMLAVPLSTPAQS